MSDGAKQLYFDLSLPEPYSLKYFVVHSGVNDAVSTIETAIAMVRDGVSSAQIIYLFGPAGTGKSHLISAYRAVAGDFEIFTDEIAIVTGTELNSDIDDEQSFVRNFTSRYEQVRSAGGLLFVEATAHPKAIVNDPHLQSRLLAGQVVALEYPREEELKPLIHSLLERRSLKITARSLEYLLRRLPRNPLSFDDIFAKINELSLGELRPSGLGVIREIMKE